MSRWWESGFEQNHSTRHITRDNIYCSWSINVNIGNALDGIYWINRFFKRTYIDFSWDRLSIRWFSFYGWICTLFWWEQWKMCDFVKLFSDNFFEKFLPSDIFEQCQSPGLVSKFLKGSWIFDQYIFLEWSIIFVQPSNTS